MESVAEARRGKGGGGLRHGLDDLRRKMDAEGYNAAVEAADRRIAQLMLDLGRLVDKQESQSGSAGAGHTAERVKRESDSAVRRGYSSAAKEWEELFGAGGDTDEEVERSSSRLPTPTARTTTSMFPPPSIAVASTRGDTEVATRYRSTVHARHPQNVSSSARVSSFPVLRRAIETILADSSPSALDGALEKERRTTFAMRRGFAELVEKRRVAQIESLPTPPTPRVEVVFHRGVQTDPDLCTQPAPKTSKTLEDVYIDPALLEETSTHRTVRGKSCNETQRPPWGGGRGRKPPKETVGGGWKRVDANKRKEDRFEPIQMADAPKKLSRFEARCAFAVSRHLAGLIEARRREVLDDWGCEHSHGFEGVELFVRVEARELTDPDEAENARRRGVFVGAGDRVFIPLEGHHVRRVRLYLGHPMSCLGVGEPGHVFLGSVRVDYDNGGRGELPELCRACVCRKKLEGSDSFRYFAQYSIREHRDIFRHAVRLLYNGS